MKFAFAYFHFQYKSFCWAIGQMKRRIYNISILTNTSTLIVSQSKRRVQFAINAFLILCGNWCNIIDRLLTPMCTLVSKVIEIGSNEKWWKFNEYKKKKSKTKKYVLNNKREPGNGKIFHTFYIGQC